MGEDGRAGFPLDDRGAAYGDGLFETVLVRDGEPLLWREHCERLEEGAARLGFEAPERAELDALPARAGAGEKILKIMLTRGSGGRGYALPDVASPRLRYRIVAFTPAAQRWREGVSMRLCRLRLAEQPLLAGLKHLNRLENVLARSEWQSPDIAEGLLRDQHERVVEATAMNVAWLENGRWLTPWLARCGVAGTLRRALLAQGLVAEVDDAGLERLVKASSLCLFNSVQGVWPVQRLFDETCSHRLGRWTITTTSGQRELQREAHSLLGHPLP
ncbi:aminodeoxychorismate lyase [Kushneria aurantia]|uniref:Aminodeoxychorismate lyase n=1 Tax=Kushneria aurantia TaxID=504092 RepID=A0ABV6G771_9GAMM